MRLPYWRLHRCPACGSLTALPRPSSQTQAGIHADDRYFEHPYFEERRRPDSVDRRCRDTFERIMAATGRSLDAGTRHLDIGCDTGEFLMAAQRIYGTVPTGVEIAPKAVEAARAAGLEIHLSAIEDLTGTAGPFDLITAIDLIEHLADPASMLGAARALLAEDGLLFIETPNPQSVVYKLAAPVTNATSARPASICQRIFLREHIQYFTPAGLVLAARAKGLAVVDVSTRRLPPKDISGSVLVRAAMYLLQSFDNSKAGKAILTTGIFRRGSTGAAGLDEA